MRVGKLVMFAALMVGAVWNDGAPAPPVAGPANTLFCAALDNENVNAGVLVAVATEVVNSGERFPAEKVVTVPLPDGFVYSHAVPLQCTKAAVDGAAIAWPSMPTTVVAPPVDVLVASPDRAVNVPLPPHDPHV